MRNEPEKEAISNQALIWQLQNNKDKIIWQIIVWLKGETGKKAGETLLHNRAIRKLLGGGDLAQELRALVVLKDPG